MNIPQQERGRGRGGRPFESRGRGPGRGRGHGRGDQDTPPSLGRGQQVRGRGFGGPGAGYGRGERGTGRGSPGRGRGGERGGGRGSPGPGGFRGSRRGGPSRTRGTAEDFAADVPAVLDEQLLGLDDLVQQLRRLEVSPAMPVRPGFGTKGEEYSVRANFFPLRVPADRTYWDYSVTISPQDAALGTRKARIFDLLEDSPQCRPYRSQLAHDYGARVVSAKELPQSFVANVTFYEKDEKRPTQNAPVYRMTFKLQHLIKTNDILRYTKGHDKHYNIQPAISALNLILQKQAATTGVRVGQNKYVLPDSDRFSLKVGLLDAYRGFFVSIRPTFDRLMVNVNVCMAALYVPGNLADAFLRIQRETNGGMISEFANRVKVVTEHYGYKKKHTAVGVSDKTARQTTFYWDEKQREITLEEYFRLKYRMVLKHPDDLPVLDVSRPSKMTPEYLPAELCVIPEYTPFRGTLDGKTTTAMLKVACNPPATNARLITTQGLPKLALTGEHAHATLAGFGMSVDDRMAVVPSRVLPAPQVQYRTGRAHVQHGSWNLVGVTFQDAAHIRKWAVLCLNDRRRGGDPFQVQAYEDFVGAFVAKLRQNGVQVAANPVHLETSPLPSAPADRHRRAAVDAIRQTLERRLDLRTKESKPDFVLVLFPSEDTQLYAGLKRLCDLELGVQTVCMILPKALAEDRRSSTRCLDNRKQEQYFANVALKVNAKLGGVNHLLAPDAMTWLKQKRTMLVGIDVTHPSAQSAAGAPSVAAVVASVDDRFVQFPVSYVLQRNRLVQRDAEEMVQGLEAAMQKKLELYRAKMKALPDRVIVYRDGVSESQFSLVIERELPQIQGAFKKFPNYSPKLSVVVCGKRHHARFFGTSPDQVMDNGNTPPGTVIDKGVTDVYNYDFYLQAHHGLQGTVRPTHYTVVYDQNDLDADTIQGEINNASYMYARATKAVSLVPPAYYADLACDRARLYLGPLMRAVEAQYAARKGDRKGKDKNTDKREAVFKEAVALWGEGVHPDVRDSMFYI